MLILRRIILVILMILLGWFFCLKFPEFDLARVKNMAFYREQISEIENSKSIPELKEIAKSKVYVIQRIHKIKDEENQKQFYIVLLIITLSIALYGIKKPIKTHNS